jgi:hypothetical protein
MEKINGIVDQFKSLKNGDNLSSFMQGISLLVNIRNKFFDPYTQEYFEK